MSSDTNQLISIYILQLFQFNLLRIVNSEHKVDRS
jgi:hypothetical protein